MRNATDLMVQYAEYHRDRRNIATHFVGIPLIVFAIGALLARPAFELGGITWTPSGIVFLLGTIWYFTRGQFALALATTLVNGVLFALGHRVAELPTATWLTISIGAFVVGWIIQFVGHYYEGRKPAFVDDLVGLMIGPMFVVGEWLFAMGWNKPLLEEIERRAGPTHLRDLTRPAA